VKSTLAPALILLLLAAANPTKAQAAAKLWCIGWLSAFAAPEEASWREAFRQGLQDHGFTEGQNVVVESRWAEGQYARLAAWLRILCARRST
jgi:putative tryptophan/tyrosine transport system substrate-binding protein